VKGHHGLAGVTATILLLFAVLDQAVADPRRVLLLHSFGQDFHPWSAVAAHFRAELRRRSSNPIDLYEASLESARLSSPSDEGPIIDYLRVLFSRRNLELVVALGAPAARFVQRHRAQFFPSTPLLITAADEKTFNASELTTNDATVPSLLELPKLIDNILQVLPDTRNIFFVIGASPLERFWIEGMRKAFQPFTTRVQFEWFNELPIDEMVRRATSLPPQSAIFYASVRVDATGVPNEQDHALTRLRKVANAPIFSYLDSNFGHGVVGGPVISTEELGRKAADAAARIRSGESAGNIRMPPVQLGVPTYDWRELQRWNISEARLPPGSIVQFRQPTMWERYRWLLMAVFAALVLQSGLIAGLLAERYRRRSAQLESKHRLAQVIHLNRSAEVGALSASFAHELSQPLAAIMVNVEAMASMLGSDPRTGDRLRSLVSETQEAAQHAIGVIRHLRKLLKGGSEGEHEELNLAEVIQDAVHVLRPEATKRGISLEANGIESPLPARADRIHLQQVIFNLSNNAMDAISHAASTHRLVTICATVREPCQVEVSIRDSGPGIPDDQLAVVFDTFYTTKAEGTGLGLSIARTIIETYGGNIWAENCAEGGAVFRFTLPLVSRAQGTVVLPLKGRQSVPAG
jgi:signal transduction histidine kinase